MQTDYIEICETCEVQQEGGDIIELKNGEKICEDCYTGKGH